MTNGDDFDTADLPALRPAGDGDGPDGSVKIANADAGPPRRGRGLSLAISWIIISGATLFMFVMNNATVVMPDADESDPASEAAVSETEAIALKSMSGEARLVIGQHAVAGTTTEEQLLKAFDTGPIPQRLRLATVIGEIAGPDRALAYLDTLEARVAAADGVEFSETEAETFDLLRTLYRDYNDALWNAPSLSDADRVHIRDELEWFGELALVPEESNDSTRSLVIGEAQTTMYVLIGAMLIAIAIGVLGLIGLIVVFVLALMKRLRDRFGGRRAHHHVYAETFAIWMLVFFGLSLVAGLVSVPGDSALFVQFIAFFLSLIVLAWPVVRGVRWGEVRRDIGWYSDDAFANVSFGLAGYAMALPLLGVGVVVMLGLMWVQGQIGGGDVAASESFDADPGAVHPIIQLFGEGGWWTVLQIYLVAAIAAPVVEETMFRGVLYRHLRSGTARWGLVWSILVSAAVNSIIFGMIHPQGWIAVPALAALAVAMSLAREWRGSLLPAIIIHGVSNGLIITLGLIAFG